MSEGIFVKNASMVLGIIGGVVSILLGLFLILGGATFMSESFWENAFSNATSTGDVQINPEYMQQYKSTGTFFMRLGIFSSISGIVGMIGGMIVRKMNVAAGVMMLVAAVLNMFVFFNVLSIILFIIGGIFALVREPQSRMPTYPSQYPRP